MRGEKGGGDRIGAFNTGFDLHRLTWLRSPLCLASISLNTWCRCRDT